jgi:23S rRNA-/tRNA-specific pseudouridylate synthase
MAPPPRGDEKNESRGGCDHGGNENGREEGGPDHGDDGSDGSDASSSSCSSSVWTRPLEVVHCDESVAVVVKPRGMPVMGAKPSLIRSNLLDPLLTMNNSGQEDGENESSSDRGERNEDLRRRPPLRKPRPVHRLDAGTGGLLVVAKTAGAEAALKRSFAQPGGVRKTYLAVVAGRLELPPRGAAGIRATSQIGGDDEDDRGGGGIGSSAETRRYGVADAPLSGKPSRTLYRPVRVVPSGGGRLGGGYLTLVEARPLTGRRHQIRRHLRDLGHPVLGDARYSSLASGARAPRSEDGPPSPPPPPYGKRLCLWAVRVELPHPDRPGSVLDCRLPRPIRGLERVLGARGRGGAPGEHDDDCYGYGYDDDKARGGGGGGDDARPPAPGGADA